METLSKLFKIRPHFFIPATILGKSVILGYQLVTVNWPYYRWRIWREVEPHTYMYKLQTDKPYGDWLVYTVNPTLKVQ